MPVLLALIPSRPCGGRALVHLVAPVQVAMLVCSAPVRALLCFGWLATWMSAMSLARFAGLAPWRSSMALARLLLRWTPRYLLGATLKKGRGRSCSLAATCTSKEWNCIIMRFFDRMCNQRPEGHQLPLKHQDGSTQFSSFAMQPRPTNGGRRPVSHGCRMLSRHFVHS